MRESEAYWKGITNLKPMREIKFRAWVSAFNNGEMVYSQIDAKTYDIRFEKYGYGLGNPSLKIMQFTGLKDKTGKEIYEGDIVEAIDKYAFPARRIQYVIRFFKGSFVGMSSKKVEVSGKDPRWVMLKLDDNMEMDTSEVIGNIYQNPELLKPNEES